MFFRGTKNNIKQTHQLYDDKLKISYIITNMKRLILTTTLLLTIGLLPTSAYMLQDNSFDFGTLNLSKKQSEMIAYIQDKYRNRIVTLNSNILLKEMEIAQLKVEKGGRAKINSIYPEIELMQSELAELQSQKEGEILSNLGFFQRIKYKKYLKS